MKSIADDLQEAFSTKLDDKIVEEVGENINWIILEKISNHIFYFFENLIKDPQLTIHILIKRNLNNEKHSIKFR